MKLTKCLVCEVTTTLTQHHIVPKCYLDKINSDSHFTVTLCRKCHNNYERRANTLKNFYPENEEVIKEKSRREKVRKAASFILNYNASKFNMPEEKAISILKEKENIIVDYFGELNLQKAIKLKLITTKPKVVLDADFTNKWFKDFIAFCRKRKVKTEYLNLLQEEYDNYLY